MTDNENRNPAAAVARKSKLGLGLGPNRDAAINRNVVTKEMKPSGRTALGIIGQNIPESRLPKPDNKIVVFKDNICKGVTTQQQHVQASVLRVQGCDAGGSISVTAASGRPCFSVHVDHNENGDDKENIPRAKLSADVTIEGSAEVKENQTTGRQVDCKKPQNKKDDHSCGAAAVRQPLSLLENRDNYSESPMVLDLSTSSSQENEAEPKDEANASFSNTNGNCSDRTVDLLLLPYAQETYTYLRQLECRCRAKPTYMRKQTDITNGMRSILVDWLVEVGSEYNLHQETLYLTVSYVDRFLSCMAVLRGKLQLVGTASMFIASKFEEVHPPEVDEFVYITDDTYTKRQVIRMEHVILKVLSFDLATPTSFFFLQRFCQISETDDQTYFLALYLCELTLLEADPYLQFLPSIIAGSSVCLARHTRDLEAWPECLRSFSSYDIESFKECLQYLFKTFCNAPNYPQQAIREKFKTPKFMEVSSIPPPTTEPL